LANPHFTKRKKVLRFLKIIDWRKEKLFKSKIKFGWAFPLLGEGDARKNCFG
jgi:hypothetical protein